jgi:hypothetical protein
MKAKILPLVVAFIVIGHPVFAQERSLLEWKGVEFVTIDQGQISYYRYGDEKFAGAAALIRDESLWKQFWTLHTYGMQPPPELPYVNFYDDMVIVALLGYQTTGGPSIEALRVNIDHNRTLHVLVADNTEPGLLTVITNPFHIIKVPKVPVWSIVFEHQK